MKKQWIINISKILQYLGYFLLEKIKSFSVLIQIKE